MVEHSRKSLEATGISVFGVTDSSPVSASVKTFLAALPSGRLVKIMSYS